MKKRLFILLVVVAALVLALAGWLVDGGRSILQPRYA